MNKVIETPATSVSAERVGLVARFRSRIARVLIAAAFLIGLPVGAANAAAPAPPNIGDSVATTAGALSNGLVDGFIDILPYVIPVLVLFTVTGYVWKMLSARKAAR